MKIESVAITEDNELMSARLDCFYAGDGDGGGWPAYRLHVDFPDKEMTLQEMIECIESLKHFLSGIYIMDESKPIFMNAVIQRFDDQFEKEKT